MIKKIINTIAVSLTVLTLAGCKKELPAAYTGQQYLEFYSLYDIKEVTTAYSSFYYLNSSRSTDTVFLRVRTVGTVPSKTSFIKLSAFTDPNTTSAYPDAVAGVQYVSFDDENIKKLMKVDAGKYEAYIPVVLKRDPSLKDKVYQLRFKITTSDDFKPGNSDHTEGIIYISDRLFQPSNWTPSFFLGSYGSVKHQFMIEQSGKPWDAAFITTLTNPVDLNAQAFYLFKFTQALKDLNATRKAAGLTELRENPLLPSTAVTFPNL
ncbi:DUF4843 domain-containing protein [Pedobacter jeongneungensis]|uniref:DUF4843 domain-containing protein n=1 Tax=Pedobacter jeongneungensis TaxID=947309 RepID=UPI000468B11F|nr:DUF4843 domain-containing protein [Pedobacter jeongneungensis]